MVVRFALSRVPTSRARSACHVRYRPHNWTSVISCNGVVSFSAWFLFCRRRAVRGARAPPMQRPERPEGHRLCFPFAPSQLDACYISNAFVPFSAWAIPILKCRRIAGLYNITKVVAVRLYAAFRVRSAQQNLALC